MAFSEDLAIFSNRLLGHDKYKSSDLLVSNCNKPDRLSICDNYVTNPGDKKIIVDAYHRDIKVVLPKYLGYEQPQQLRISRSDNSCNIVKVKSDQFTLKLGCGGCATLRWSQPFYQDGSWEIVHVNHCKSRSKKARSVESVRTNKHHESVCHLYLV